MTSAIEIHNTSFGSSLKFLENFSYFRLFVFKLNFKFNLILLGAVGLDHRQKLREVGILYNVIVRNNYWEITQIYF